MESSGFALRYFLGDRCCLLVFRHAAENFVGSGF